MDYGSFVSRCSASPRSWRRRHHNLNVSFSTVLSTRGHMHLFTSDGYSYGQCRGMKCGLVSWRCSVRGCLAMAYTDTDGTALCDIRGKHCHSAQPRAVQKRLLSAKVRLQLQENEEYHPSHLVNIGMQDMEMQDLRSKDIRDIHQSVSRWRKVQQVRRSKMKSTGAGAGAGGEASDAEQDVSLADVLQGEDDDTEVVAESVSVPDVENIVILATEHQHQQHQNVQRSNKLSQVIKLKTK